VEIALDKEERGKDSTRRLLGVESEIKFGAMHSRNLASKTADSELTLDAIIDIVVLWALWIPL
jgi:hypothetical protein